MRKLTFREAILFFGGNIVLIGLCVWIWKANNLEWKTSAPLIYRAIMLDLMAAAGVAILLGISKILPDFLIDVFNLTWSRESTDDEVAFDAFFIAWEISSNKAELPYTIFKIFLWILIIILATIGISMLPDPTEFARFVRELILSIMSAAAFYGSRFIIKWAKLGEIPAAEDLV